MSHPETNDQHEIGERHRHVLHITSADQWAQQKGDRVFRDASLDAEGFIHCSTVDQLLIPANERFVGRADLVLLVVDTTELQAELVYEDCYESGTEFPHIYGPINRSAVIRVIDFPPDADGRFSCPVSLGALGSPAAAGSDNLDGPTPSIA